MCTRGLVSMAGMAIWGLPGREECVNNNQLNEVFFFLTCPVLHHDSSMVVWLPYCSEQIYFTKRSLFRFGIKCYSSYYLFILICFLRILLITAGLEKHAKVNRGDKGREKTEKGSGPPSPPGTSPPCINQGQSPSLQ